MCNWLLQCRKIQPCRALRFRCCITGVLFRQQRPCHATATLSGDRNPNYIALFIAIISCLNLSLPFCIVIFKTFIWNLLPRVEVKRLIDSIAVPNHRAFKCIIDFFRPSTDGLSLIWSKLNASKASAPKVKHQHFSMLDWKLIQFRKKCI